MQIIPVVFSTDDFYVMPLMVAINSLKKTKSQYVCLNVFILTQSLKEENKQKILLLQENNFNIFFVNISDYVNESLYAKERFSVAMYYRFFIPLILKEYSKVIYLDCDVVVNKCISNLYNCDLGDNILGACLDCNGLQRSTNYFNSGILLFNVEKFNENQISDKCIEFLQDNRNLCYPDQDTLNEVCRGKICCLPSIFNYMTSASYDKGTGKVDKEKALKIFEVKRDKNVVIYHFTDRFKPWITKNAPYAQVWWKNAKTLPKKIFKELKQYSRSALNKALIEYKVSVERDYYFNHFFNFYTKTKKQRIKIWLKRIFCSKK